MQKKYIVFALFFAFFSAALCSAVLFSPSKAYAADADNTDAYKIAYDESGEFGYSKLERTDYATEQYCEYVGADSSRYDGVYGKTAVKKDSSNKNYQLFFRKAFARGKSYEVSFRAKFNSPAAQTYVFVWYTGYEGSVQVNTNKDLPALRSEQGGGWIKYSFTFKSDDKGIYESLLRLTLECKNLAADTEIFFDEFHAYEVADDNSLISGEETNEEEWTLEGNAEKSGFTAAGAPFALKLSSRTAITSKFLNARTNGVLRVKFAYKADSGAALYFGIKDAFGNVIGETDLTATADKAIVNIVTGDLKSYDFVRIFFRTENGSAVVGLTEVIPHTHEFADGNGYPKYDLNNCKTIRFCKICGFEVDFIKHNLTVVKEATCNTDGRKECIDCHNYSETIPATGKHVYDKDATCSPDNPREKVKCSACGETMWLQKAHAFEYVSVGDDAHIKKCSACGYEEQSSHRVGEVSLVVSPAKKETGVAVCVCEECGNSYMTELPSLADESAWRKTILKEVGCEEDGLEEYFWLNGDLSIESVVEAVGHEYEEIHTSATCEAEGKSVYHKCRVCGDIYENPEDIVVFAPLGHSESEWITEIAPTTRSEGLQRKYCNRCKKITEERVVPKLNVSDYDKYILEDPEKTDGYLYRYTSKIYGTFTEYEPKGNSDKILVIVLPIVFVITLVVSVVLFIIFTEKGKNK